MTWDWLVVAALILVVAWSAAALAGLVLKVNVRFAEWLNAQDSPRPSTRRNGR